MRVGEYAPSDFHWLCRSEYRSGALTPSQRSESGKYISSCVGITNLIGRHPDAIPNHVPLGRSKRCVPGTPCCVRCMTMRIECRYGPAKTRGVGSTLPIGQACVLCR